MGSGASELPLTLAECAPAPHRAQVVCVRSGISELPLTQPACAPAPHHAQVVRMLKTNYRMLITGTPLQNNLHE